MAKLTLNFKGKPLRVYHPESGELTIGRDEQCAVQIDSLAVAPIHASIQLKDDGSWLLEPMGDAPVFVNKKKIDCHRLGDGDRIVIGKHEIVYRDQENIVEVSFDTKPSDAISEVIDELENLQCAPTATIQYLNGDHIGLMIPLKQAMTRLGKSSSSGAVIAKRKEGFYISSLEDGAIVKLNGTPIDDISVKLTHWDKIEIDKIHLQFFLAVHRG